MVRPGRCGIATVALTIVGPQAKPVAHRPKAPPSLAGGLGAGWHALKLTLSWTLAFLGAIGRSIWEDSVRAYEASGQGEAAASAGRAQIAERYLGFIAQWKP